VAVTNNGFAHRCASLSALPKKILALLPIRLPEPEDDF
jgi:hypothetical protein